GRDRPRRRSQKRGLRLLPAPVVGRQLRVPRRQGGRAGRDRREHDAPAHGGRPPRRRERPHAHRRRLGFLIGKPAAMTRAGGRGHHALLTGASLPLAGAAVILRGGGQRMGKKRKGRPVFRFVVDCRSREEFLAAFSPLCDGTSLVLVTPEVPPAGMKIEFTLRLSTGEQLLAGKGTVLSTFSDTPSRGALRLKPTVMDGVSQALLAELGRCGGEPIPMPARLRDALDRLAMAYVIDEAPRSRPPAPPIPDAAPAPRAGAAPAPVAITDAPTAPVAVTEAAPVAATDAPSAPV